MKNSQEKRRVDRTWLIGSNNVSSGSVPAVGAPWATHMVLLSQLHAKYKDADGEERRGMSSISSMAVDAGESLLATGGKGGEILIWDLRQHPPCVKSCFSQTNKKRGMEISQVGFADKGNMGVACDGNIHVFDVEQNVELAFLKRRDRGENSDAGRIGGGEGMPGVGGIGIGIDEFNLGISVDIRDYDPFVAFHCLPQGVVNAMTDDNSAGLELLALSRSR